MCMDAWKQFTLHSSSIVLRKAYPQRLCRGHSLFVMRDKRLSMQGTRCMRPPGVALQAALSFHLVRLYSSCKRISFQQRLRERPRASCRIISDRTELKIIHLRFGWGESHKFHMRLRSFCSAGIGGMFHASSRQSNTQVKYPGAISCFCVYPPPPPPNL